MDDKMHLKLFTFSQEDYKQVALLWNGTHPEDGQPLEVIQRAIPGNAVPDLDEEPQLNAPGSDEYAYDPQLFADMAGKMGSSYNGGSCRMHNGLTRSKTHQPVVH